MPAPPADSKAEKKAEPAQDAEALRQEVSSLREQLKALEDRLNPRTREWERLLKETGVPGIYYEDYPELSSFVCPEWSHLNAGDSVEFSKRLVPHLRNALQL